jgi:hypothetical protein
VRSLACVFRQEKEASIAAPKSILKGHCSKGIRSIEYTRKFGSEEEKSMRESYWRVVSWMGVLALAVGIVPGALAQCGLSMTAIKPSAWQPQSGGAYDPLVRVSDDNHGEQGSSIVGMWHVIFTANTINGNPFSGVIDNALVVWHSDGTEIMNSSRPAQDGNFCLGLWARTGKRKYYLNHIAWQGNGIENAPSGIGNPQGGAQIIERVTLSPNGNSYSGTFTLDAYDTSGNVTVSFTGVLTAHRVTLGTSLSDLLSQ